MSGNKRKVSFDASVEKPAKIQKNDDGSSGSGSDEEAAPFEWKNFAQGAQEAVEAYDSFSHTIKRRISSLDQIQGTIDELTKGYEKEYNALIAKYQNLRHPILEKRKSIIAGTYEPTDAEIADDALKAPVAADEKKGIPEFWTRVFTITNFHAILGEKDLEALNHVVDVRAVTKTQDEFDFEFHFSENEFFTNDIIRRTFHITHTDDGSDTINRSEGTVINWKNKENVEKEEWSFFSMFEGEWVPEDPNGNEHQEFMDIILQLKEMILNNPTKYFKMDAQLDIPDISDDEADEDDYGFEDFGDEEEGEDEEDEGEGDEEADDSDKKPTIKRSAGGKNVQSKFSKGDKKKVKITGKSLKADDSEKPPECKQQ